VTAPACPVCDRPLEIPDTGRRPVYCGKACRQAAYRARLAAARAAEHARWLRRKLAGDYRAGKPVDGMHAELQEAGSALTAAFYGLELDLADGDGDGGVPSGWEARLSASARTLAGVAHRIADTAHAHERAVAEFEAAQAVLCRGGRGRPGGDETPAGSVPPRAAPDRATKPGGPGAAVADRDALFDAVEDVVYRLDRTRLYLLPDEVAEVLEGPAAELAEVFAHQAGDGPLGELATAAAAVLAAARRCQGLPADVAGALAALASTMPAAVGAA
jgi:hypothetical protein